MKANNLKEARRRASLLEEQKKTWLPRWQDAARWISHWRGQPGGDSLGQSAGFETTKADEQRILDATASRAVRVLAAGLQSGLTSPARPWFRLRRGGDEDRESGMERRWLDVVEETLYATFAGSNFYQAIHSLYTELAVFGSATMYMETDPERQMRFSTLSCGDFAWACNASGRVDTVLRRLQLSPRQMAQIWGDNKLSTAARQALERAPDTLLPIMHLVFPRNERDPGKYGKANMAYASLVWEQDTVADAFLHEGGFEEFPFMCARWDVVGAEVYGRSPGMETLPDIRLLQEMVKSQLLAIHKVVNPPMRVPAGYKQRLSLIPGAINYIAPGQPEGIGPLYQISPDITALTRKIEDVRDAVRQGFFNDLFLMFAGDARSNVTAAEINERGQEKMLLLGPVIERHQTDILDPLLTRAFGMLRRAGAIPHPPQSLEGQEIRVEYVSSLAQAQRAGGAEAIRRIATEVANLATLAPTIVDKLDIEQAVDELASLSGVPSRIIRSDAEVKELRRQREASSMAGNGEDTDEVSLEGVLQQFLAAVPGVSKTDGTEEKSAVPNQQGARNGG